LLIKEPIVFLGAKEDYIQAQNIIDHFQQQQNKPCFPLLYNGCGLYNLNQSASLLKQSAWVIAHDTGLMHIAAAFKKKIYSIWGNTVPDFGMYPYQTEYVVWENKGLYCRPCSKIGYSVCPKGHFRCMNDIIFKL
jgi:ADP-heptose:LPS heptosyltransferase